VSYQPTPQDYAMVFEDHKVGAAIFEQMTARFANKVYVKGGLEADRQTCYNAGQRDVIEFIVKQINRAHGVVNEDPEEPND